MGGSYRHLLDAARLDGIFARSGIAAFACPVYGVSVVFIVSRVRGCANAAGERGVDLPAVCRTWLAGAGHYY